MKREIDEIFKQWKQILSLCYENNDKTTEIHRDNLERVMAYTRQLENIIKEVREYIEKNTEEKKSWLNGIPDYTVFKGDAKELLEILDKEN